MEWMRAELDGLGVDSLVFRETFYNRYVRGQEDKVTERMQLNISKPCAKSKIHSQMKLTKGWPILEIFPGLTSRSTWPNQKGWLGYYIPLGQYRHIPENAVIDPSFFERREDPVLGYDPPNLRGR
jgi:hypothetical protein